MFKVQNCSIRHCSFAKRPQIRKIAGITKVLLRDGVKGVKYVFKVLLENLWSSDSLLKNFPMIPQLCRAETPKLASEERPEGLLCFCKWLLGSQHKGNTIIKKGFRNLLAEVPEVLHRFSQG